LFDQPHALALPAKPYQFAEWKIATVNIDYHIEIEQHYYSVPYELKGEKLQVRLSANTIEALRKGQRVATHLRSLVPHRHTTLKEHMPKAHQQFLDWTPSRILRWAQQLGPNTEKLVTHILENKPHPQQGFRSCLGIFRLGKQYSKERLEAACAYALSIHGFFYKSVESILKHGLDQKNTLTLPSPEEPLPLAHPNIRGKEYYQ